MAGPGRTGQAPGMAPPEAAALDALTESRAEPTPGPATGEGTTARAVATRQNIEMARRRALEIDRALSELRASLRETGPAAPSGAQPDRADSELEPAAAYRWLLLDGHEAFCRGRYADALAAFEEAVRDAPRRVEGHLNTGRTLLRLRRVDEARDAFARALALEPGNAAGAAGLADCDWRARLPVLDEPPARPAARRFPFRFLPAQPRRAH